jgi:1,2-diacylglycerol 3-alpha-glucosyltransferase
MKIAALTTVSCPYVVARYSAFTKTFPDSYLFLIELGEVSAIYGWKQAESVTPYQRIVLSHQPAEQQSSIFLFKIITKALNTIQPDVIVLCGYGIPGMLEAFVWGLWHRKATILLSDTKEDDASRSFLKETLKSLLVRNYKAALVAGRSHKRYLMKLGMQDEAISLGYDVVGNDAFHPDKIKHLAVPIEKPYFLAINRFVSKKNILFLISSYAAYRKLVGGSAWDLIICGEGELRLQIEQQITTLDLVSVVHLPGFLQQDEMLPYFAHASCFIHASIQEQWGLVVNEAMAAGLPILLSDRCGCFEDLLLEGVNGFGFDPKNSQELANLMLKVSSDQVDLQAMSQASLEHIQNFSPDYFVQGLMQAIKYAMEPKKKH